MDGSSSLRLLSGWPYIRQRLARGRERRCNCTVGASPGGVGLIAQHKVDLSAVFQLVIGEIALFVRLPVQGDTLDVYVSGL